MNLLIIGGTGFFGKAILSFIKTSSFNSYNSITIVGRSASFFEIENEEYKSLKNINFINADITESLDHLANLDFTHIIHAAADSTNVLSIGHIDRFDQILAGTRNVLDFISMNYKESKFLFISSGGVYGKMPNNIKSFKEDDSYSPDPLNINNVYSIAKKTAEHLCVLYSKEFSLNLSIARCFSFSGQDLPLDVHFAIGNFIRNAINGEDIIIKGDGSSIRSYLDQDDLAEWLLVILNKDKFNNSFYNIGSDVQISIIDLAEKVSKLSNKDISVKVLNKNDSNLLRSVYVPSVLKIKNQLGVSEKICLDKSIIKMLTSSN